MFSENYPKPHVNLENIDRARLADRALLSVARGTLLVGLYVLAREAVVHEPPSQVENKNVTRCAEKLYVEPKAVAPDKLPDECDKYSVDFSTTPSSFNSMKLGVQNIVLPAKEKFLREYVVGKQFDQEKHDEEVELGGLALGLSSISYLGYGFRRRLQKVDEAIAVKHQMSHIDNLVQVNMINFEQELDAVLRRDDNS